MRQTAAAQGYPINWHVQKIAVADASQDTFAQRGLSSINVAHPLF